MTVAAEGVAAALVVRGEAAETAGGSQAAETAGKAALAKEEARVARAAGTTACPESTPRAGPSCFGSSCTPGQHGRSA